MAAENRNRTQVEQLIHLLPGVHLRRLSRLLGLSLSTTRHHLKSLECAGEILCSKEGEYLRAYPSSMREEDERRLYALLQYGTARRVLKALIKESTKGRGLTNDELSAVARLSPSLVSEHARSFRNLGLVRKVLTSEGRWNLVVEDREREHVLSVISRLERNLLTVTTDSFIDLWEF